MWKKDEIGIPETDEQAESILKNCGGAGAAVGIYRIFRKRDGMSVFDAYMATLNHVIEIGEKDRNEK